MNQIMQSTKFIHSVFEYFNGKVNKIICPFCRFGIPGYMDQYASISTKGFITLYVDKYMDLDNGTKTKICLAIIHELSHLNQSIDFYKYANSEEYRMRIEDANELRSIDIMINNMDQIERDLNFKINYNFLYCRKLQINSASNYIESTELEKTMYLIYGAIPTEQYIKYQNMLLLADTVIIKQSNHNDIIVKQNEYIIPFGQLSEALYKKSSIDQYIKNKTSFNNKIMIIERIISLTELVCRME